MYVKYCENKPKSEYIVAEFIDFFEVQTRVLFVHCTVEDLLPFCTKQSENRLKIQWNICNYFHLSF